MNRAERRRQKRSEQKQNKKENKIIDFPKPSIELVEEENTDYGDEFFFYRIIRDGKSTVELLEGYGEEVAFYYQGMPSFMKLIDESTVGEIISSTNDFTKEELLEEANFFAESNFIKIVWDLENKMPIPRIDCSCTPDVWRFDLPDNPEPDWSMSVTLYEIYEDILSGSLPKELKPTGKSYKNPDWVHPLTGKGHEEYEEI